MGTSQARYFVFDIESVADGNLIANIRYPEEGLSPEEAIDRYRKELLEKYGTDFVPYTFQVPVSVAIAKVDKHYQLLDLVTLDEPLFRPHVITENFWRGWQSYKMPTLVSFNGRTFDLPLMELAAFRYGVSASEWFNLEDRSYEQKRNRYNVGAHFDLHDVLTNFGASRFTGGLNLAANILGKPGKTDESGEMVQDIFNEGDYERINNYCRRDVLDTYFVFLRVLLMLGKIDNEQEESIVGDAKKWLENRSEEMEVYDSYLKNWGDWPNPWLEKANHIK